ncbi:hypothetical protein [Bacillus sp. T33-2]|uniref:hypothetical protein n=1 Tax=Bacillus sp. T33-2 TaxID=2054168 RepID=UPI000C75CBC2|nr:hypothetical protein [Bacillus sp. T33-2]PLR89125.1 hypothetical protein CVD19_23910 [Bacillus sp. T33-2]
MGEHFFQFFIDGAVVKVSTADEIKKQYPDWAGEYMIGDLMEIDGEERHVTEVHEQFARHEDDHFTRVVLS